MHLFAYVWLEFILIIPAYKFICYEDLAVFLIKTKSAFRVAGIIFTRKF